MVRTVLQGLHIQLRLLPRSTQQQALLTAHALARRADWVPGEAFAGPHGFLPDKEVRHDLLAS
jgi:hypothetical protein